MISTDKVEFRENGSPVHGCGEILYVRNGIMVSDGGTVQDAIVSTWSPVAWCFFGNHVNRG